MLADILKHYKLTGDFSRVGFYQSKELVRVEENLREHIRLGYFTALTGSVGAGKTTLVRKMIADLKKSKAALVSESMSMEKERVNLSSLVNALYMDFGEKPDKERENRDRKLFQLIEKSGRRVTLFIDDAHSLQNKTLFGLKALVEKGLCVVLVGHPRLAFNLKRGVMEEIGMRCECLELQGLTGEVGSYLKWLIEEAKGKIEIFSQEAREEIEQLCRTPLQVQRICWEAIKQGYQEGEKQISRDTILNVIMPDFRDLRTELRRKGYTARDLANDYGYSTTQVNRFLDGKLPADDPTGKTLSVFLKTLGIGR
jgi:type II secretory pathway predicted ATPase ExeA